MTIVKCNSETCLHSFEGICRRDEIEIQLQDPFNGLATFNDCMSYEEKEDFVTFMEERGLG